MSEKKLFLIDAFAIIYRAYFAFGSNQRYNSQGLNTSATLGFTNTILDVLNKENPTHIGVVFDSPGKTFREDKFPAYKAHREAMPEDIRKAIPYIKKIVHAMDIPLIEKEGYEADDIIGTIAQKAEKEGFKTYLMTPDKDFAQLVTDNIFLYRPGNAFKPTEVWGVDKVREKFEVENVLQVIDILGLWGDAADNIPGIPGIGEKTSKILIQKYGSVENLIDHAHELKGKQKENVIEFAEQGKLSKWLATIEVNVPLEYDFHNLVRTPYNEDALNELFSELEFRTLAKRVLGTEIQSTNNTPVAKKAANSPVDLFSQEADVAVEEAPVLSELKSFESSQKTYLLTETPEKISRLVQALKGQNSFCFDTETTGLDSLTADIVGLSFSFATNTGFYVPVNPENRAEILAQFKEIFENPASEKIGQNIKYDINILKQHNIQVNGRLFDTMIAHYLIEPDLRHNMDYLSETYLNYRPISIESLIGKNGKNQLNMKDVPLEQIKNYAAEDADVTFQLKQIFAPLLEKTKTLELFNNIEMPLVKVLSDMENEGVSIDAPAMQEYSKLLEKEIADLEKFIIEQAGETFNVSSPKQMGEILFDKLKIIDKPKKTKTGQYQTDEETLQTLVGKHPIIPPLLDYRQLKKLKSTYVDVLPTLANPNTGKIHTSFNQAVAATGRLSSNNPNLQNIPIKTEKGREVRKAFVASPGNQILSADYSQVELRIMAEISGDEGMLEAFKQGLDIHSATAAKVFNVDLADVTKEMRGKAKMVNFGIIYGISAFGLAQRLGISRTESAEIIKNYFAKYPKVQSYMSDTVDFAKEHGYVETIMGRRRYLKDINSANAVVRGYAERNAINAPIQGSAADIIKKAMIDIQAELKKQGLKSKMILQVHDELLFDVPFDEQEIIKPIVRKGMENAVKMNVPLIVDMNFGHSWLEAH